MNLFGVIFLLFACQNVIPSANSASIQYHCFQYLSYKLDENAAYWPTVQPFNFTKKTANNDNGYFYASNNFESGEHVGTHIDAPYHFNVNGWKVGDIPLEKFHVSGILIQAIDEAAENRDYALPPKKLEDWENENGPIPENSFIVFNFGWAEKYPNKEEYFGSENLNVSDLHFPGLSAEAAKWIAERKEIVGVGLDTPSLDPGIDAQFPAHILLTGANKYIIENLALHDVELPCKDFNVFISPLNIKEGTGAPTNVYSVRSHCV